MSRAVSVSRGHAKGNRRKCRRCLVVPVGRPVSLVSGLCHRCEAQEAAVLQARRECPAGPPPGAEAVFVKLAEALGIRCLPEHREQVSAAVIYRTSRTLDVCAALQERYGSRDPKKPISSALAAAATRLRERCVELLDASSRRRSEHPVATMSRILGRPGMADLMEEVGV